MCSDCLAKLLYIPHGSDNTLMEIGMLKEKENFISHMVQIIPGSSKANHVASKYFISHMVQIIRGNLK